MKITVIESKSKYIGTDRIKILIESGKDKGKLLFKTGEPEDNSFNRNLSDVYNIPDALKLAYDAGKNGEEWVEEWIDDDGEEDYEDEDYEDED